MTRATMLLSLVVTLSATTAAGEVSVTITPPMAPPAPVAIGWAPPPMLDEAPGDPPFDDAIWVGGYWTWDDDWVWARPVERRPPPRPAALPPRPAGGGHRR